MEFNGKLRLLLYGPDLINHESEYVTREDYDELPRLKDYLAMVMQHCGGVGLAAPQVGIFKDIFIFQNEYQGVIGLVNPHVTQMFGKEIVEPEGCLSLPPFGNECPVPRMESVLVEAGTIEKPDVKRHFKFTRTEARVVQHELDHLTGTFFIDRVGEKQKRLVVEKFNHWKRTWESAGRPFPY